MNINELISFYITSKQLAWAPSTLKSETARLQRFKKFLVPPKPQSLWRECEAVLAPYSRLTLWTRVVEFYDWMLTEGHQTGQNPFKQFKQNNRRLFKHAYQRRTPDISYQEALERIQSLPDESVRTKAMELIRTGMRYAESYNQADGGVIGKGNKWRPLYGEPGSDETALYRGSYHRFLRALRGIGLKPHDLRKIAATHFYSLGLSQIDLCKVMGWSSFETATSYIAPKKDEAIRKIIKGEQE